MTAPLSTGYGPSRRLYFDGDQAKYELWEVKFLGQMRLLKLHDVLVPRADENEPPCSEKNCDAFAELIQYLDDRSLSLVIRDARDDGRKALKILRDHYLGNGKPRVIALYTELTSLVLGKDESITDYVIRAETAANSLKMAGESISDSLLIAMVLKGLTSTYKTFSAIITHQDKVSTFCDFKSALRSYDEGEKYASNMDDGVMNGNRLTRAPKIPRVLGAARLDTNHSSASRKRNGATFATPNRIRPRNVGNGIL
ncbi:Uncharacterised protein r2_g2903 [Pycnogonum litorale]